MPKNDAERARAYYQRHKKAVLFRKAIKRCRDGWALETLLPVGLIIHTKKWFVITPATPSGGYKGDPGGYIKGTLITPVDLPGEKYIEIWATPLLYFALQVGVQIFI